MAFSPLRASLPRSRGMVSSLTLAAFAAMLCIFATGAAAAPPDNADPGMAVWFQTLRQPGTGISCCSIADCRQTEYRTSELGRYEALIEGRWMDVPPEKVLDHTENPTGRAVVCYLPGQGIMCFVRPSET
jgi:hypothetical protein